MRCRDETNNYWSFAGLMLHVNMTQDDIKFIPFIPSKNKT